MITGASVAQVIEIIGHAKATKTKELAKALRHFGFECPDRCKPIAHGPIPDLALAQVHSPLMKQHNWHWVAIHEGKIFDGAYGTKTGKLNWPKSFRITSCLPVNTASGVVLL